MARERVNSEGVNFADGAELHADQGGVRSRVREAPWHATALIDGKPGSGETLHAGESVGRIAGRWARSCRQPPPMRNVQSPALTPRSPRGIRSAPTSARRFCCKVADAFEANRGEFLARCTLEAGKTLADGVAEVREAVDFLRYYALAGAREFGGERVLVGPTGERNSLRLRGRGVFACISPWNFPLAIFTGQVARRAGGWQRRDREAGGTDAAHRGAGDSVDALRRACPFRCCSSCRATVARSVPR